MSKVFFSVGLSADGFMAGLNGGPANPLGDGGTDVHQWMYGLKSFLSRVGVEGGESGSKDDDVVRTVFDRTGAYIMGKRMFEEGEANWPEHAPFQAPVFVMTHEQRGPWERKGGTTFHFTNDSLVNVLEKARQAAGGKDVRINGGAHMIRQYLNAGLVDEFCVHLSPVILGRGIRLFDDMNRQAFSLEVTDVVPSAQVTHLYYKVKNT